MRHTEPVDLARRTIPPGHRSITGWMPSRYPSGHLPFESKLEHDFLLLLQIDHCVHDVVTQPMTLSLNVEGKTRAYTPDVLVTWHGSMLHPYPQQRVVFEVKPLDVLRAQRVSLSPKYRAARRHLARQGIGYRVVTERTIRTARLGNAELIAPTLRQPQDLEMEAAVTKLVRGRGPQQLDEIRLTLEAEGAIRNSVLEAVYRMIGSRWIACDLDRPITDATVVTWWADALAREQDGRT